MPPKTMFTVEKDFRNYIVDLLEELKDVFREEDIKVIKNTQFLTDWAGLAAKMKEIIRPIVVNLETKKFVKHAHKVARVVHEV